MSKAKVGDIVLHKDGQYECRVLDVQKDEDRGDEYSAYLLEECRDGSKFYENEDYLIIE